MHILCTFNWSVVHVQQHTCMQCAHEHAHTWPGPYIPNSSSSWSVYMHHSLYDHDHTPRNEVGTRLHHGYVRRDTNVTWCVHVIFLWTEAEVAIDCWRLGCGEMRCALSPLYADLKLLCGRVHTLPWRMLKRKYEKANIAQSPRKIGSGYQRKTPIALFRMLSLAVQLTIAWSS